MDPAFSFLSFPGPIGPPPHPAVAVCVPQLNRSRDEIAFVKGYAHALEVHGLDARSDDRAV